MSVTKSPNTTVSPREVLRKYKTIAVVGASKNPQKDANTVPQFMKDHGYKIIPINPTADEIVGEKAYPSLTDLPSDLASKVELVDVFRPSEELPQVAQQVVDMHRKYGRPLVFWAQLGLENEEAKQILLKNQIPYIMNACLRIVQRTI
ncbi:CoA-binding protein [Candidatus Bathyarchaeota archaeon]|nr:MAG: CoA-binding protein [Candidatus Bathyarchaeota archaeon]